MKIKKLPAKVLSVLQARGWNDEDISKMSKHTAFCEYCMWHGLNGWGAHLLEILEDLEDAQ
jgi:hypothetical protein